MKTTDYLKKSMFAVLIAFTALACSDSKSSRQEVVISGSVQQDPPSQASKTFGDHDGTQSDEMDPSQDRWTNVSGVAVYAAQVTSTGSIQAIQGTEVTTNAQGRFNVTIDASAAQHIVIVAEKEGRKRMGFVAAQLESGATYVLKPISVESTAETEIFARVVANGHAGLVSKADIESAVSAELAARISGNASAVASMATALRNAAQARAEFYTRKASGNAQQQLQAAMRTKIEAQFNLEGSLATATTASQREAAYEAFMQATINAYAQHGLNTAEAAILIDKWVRIYLNSLGTVSSDVRNEARKSVAVMLGLAIEAGIRADAAVAGASNATVQAIATAGTNLKTAIRASSGVRAEIEAAFETFYDEVEAAFNSDQSFNSEVFLVVHTEVNMNNGAMTVFRVAVNSTTSATLAGTAYTTLMSSVRGTSEMRFAGSSESQIEAYSRLIILFNLGR